jgi:hypothetical protein
MIDGIVNIPLGHLIRKARHGDILLGRVME